MRKLATLFIFSLFLSTIAFAGEVEVKQEVLANVNVKAEEAKKELLGLVESLNKPISSTEKSEILKKISHIAVENDANKDVISAIDDNTLKVALAFVKDDKLATIDEKGEVLRIIGVSKNKSFIPDLVNLNREYLDPDKSTIDYFDLSYSAFSSLISCTLDDVTYSQAEQQATSLLSYALGAEMVDMRILQTYGGQITRKEVKEPFELEIKAFEKLKNMFPNDPYVYHVLIMSYYLRNDFGPAVELSKEIIAKVEKSRPEDALNLRRNLAAILSDGMKDYKGALEQVQILLKAKPNNSEYYFLASGMYFNLNQTQDAEKICLEGLKIDAKNDKLYQLLSDIYLEEKRYDESIAKIKEAIRIASEEVDKIKSDGNKISEEYSLAAPVMQAFKENTSQIIMRYNYYNLKLGKIYFLKGDYDNSRVYLNLVIEKSPGNVGIKEEAENFLKEIKKIKGEQ